MRMLLDAHAILWFVDNPSKLSVVAQKAIVDPANDLLLSAATIWEIAIKVARGKLTLSVPYQAFMDQLIANLGLQILPITVPYCQSLLALPFHHGDPFDRIILAQATVEQVPIVSSDSVFDQYAVPRIW